MPAVGALRPRIMMMRVAASRIALLFSSLLGLGIYLVLGTFSTSGSQNPAAPASGRVNCTLDARTFVPGGGGALDCNPPNLPTSSTSTNTNLTVTPGTIVSAATLAFSGCQ